MTFQSPFSRMDGRYILVTIQSTFSAFQLPFRRLSGIYLISLMRLRGNSWFRDFHSFKFVLETSMASQIVSQIYWQFTIMGMNFINKYEIARPGDNTVSAMRTYVLIPCMCVLIPLRNICDFSVISKVWISTKTAIQTIIYHSPTKDGKNSCSSNQNTK